MAKNVKRRAVMEGRKSLKSAILKVRVDQYPQVWSTADACYVYLQVADVADYKAMSDAICESFSWKPIDVLICNAGLTRSGYMDQVAVEDLELTVRTNILGVVYAVHAVLPLMKKRSPNHPMAIVLMGSLASLVSINMHCLNVTCRSM